MPNAITFSRIAALVDAPDFRGATPVPDDKLETAFEQHAKLVCQGPAFKRMHLALMDVAAANDSHAHWLRAERAPNAYIAPLVEGSTEESMPLMARFPTRKLECTIGDMAWLVRAFAVTTSHALQNDGGKTRLWLNMEACPKDPDPAHRPTEADAMQFLNMAEAMERKAMPELFCAYKAALGEVVGSRIRVSKPGTPRIRINLTDADTRPAAALLDMLVKKKTPAHIIRQSGDGIHPEAREALSALDHYARHATHTEAENPDYEVTLLPDVEGMRGMVFQRETEAEGTLITGLVRRLGARGSYDHLPAHMQRPYNTENYLRSISGAIPLSEAVARRVAARFDAVRTRAPELTH